MEGWWRVIGGLRDGSEKLDGESWWMEGWGAHGRLDGGRGVWMEDGTGWETETEQENCSEPHESKPSQNPSEKPKRNAALLLIAPYVLDLPWHVRMCCRVVDALTR